MNYTTFAEDPALFLTELLISIVITLFAYGSFPLIFAFLRKKEITKRKYRVLCFLFNGLVFSLFFLFLGPSSGGAYLLWTSVFTHIGINMLDAKYAITKRPSKKNKKSATKETPYTGISERIPSETTNIIEEISEADKK